MNGFGAEPAARRGEEMRDLNEHDLPIWACERPRDFQLKRTFNIRAQIVFPTDRLMHLYYIEFVDIYL
jgi:hypothetical protein